MSGKYARSVYGSTLQAMTATPASATETTCTVPGALCDGDKGMASATRCAAVTVGLIESGGGEGVGGVKEKIRIPRQLWRMVMALLEDSAYQQPGLFVEKGVELEVQGIQEAVDSGHDFPPHCAHSMVEVGGSYGTS